MFYLRTKLISFQIKNYGVKGGSVKKSLLNEGVKQSKQVHSKLLTRQYHQGLVYNGESLGISNVLNGLYSTKYVARTSPNLLAGISNFSTTVGTSATESTDDTSSTNKVPLDADLLEKMKKDLVLADVNKDGRIDAEELKIILKKYPDTFSDIDVVKITDLFFVAKGGESVSHEQFINAISVAMGNDLHDKEQGGDEQGFGGYPLGLGRCGAEYTYGKIREAYTPEELDVKVTHIPPVTKKDKLALLAVRIVRVCFDTVSLWNFGEVTQAKIFRRVIFLETVAAIPGFVAAMVRHFKSLRNFSRDGGMLNMFLDEANNERMHLLTFVRMRNPPKIMKYIVLVSQTFVGAGFLILYNISPDFCHRFVGYVEEEACHTYTDIIKHIENAPEGSDLIPWRTEQAPAIARGYWRLPESATVLDLMYVVRADEAEHRDVNHICTGLKEDQISPFYNPDEKFDKVLKKYVKELMKVKDGTVSS